MLVLRHKVVILGAITAMTAVVQATPGAWITPSPGDLNAVIPAVEALYVDLHQTPELAMHEYHTAAKLAEHLKTMGYEVTTAVGGTGVVGVLKNGPGHTVLLRTELDALPIEENSGVPFASHVRDTTASGVSTPVMHDCGHDIRMSSLIGTAQLMVTNRKRWHGTLVLIGQPAEETGEGAVAMIKDGLLTRFPRPEYALSIHDDANLPSGEVGYTPGYSERRD
jgi:amidohydrolase